MIETLLHTRFISLVITPDPNSRQQVDAVLSRHWPGMIVVEADNPSEGLVHVMSLKPDLILLELGLPGIDVTELAHLIRSLNTNTVLVGMTADPQLNSHAPVMHSGVDYCVSLAPSGQSWLIHLIDSLRPGQTHHSLPGRAQRPAVHRR